MQKYTPELDLSELPTFQRLKVHTAQARRVEAERQLDQAKQWLESARYTLDRARHEEKVALNNYVSAEIKLAKSLENEELE